MGKFVQGQISRGVAVLTMNRAPANALDLELLEELRAEVAAAALDREVGAVVITGTGRLFAAGADIKLLRDLEPSAFEGYVATIQHTFDAIESCSLPTIAALNGHALGGGLELALACDLRFAAKGVQLGLPEVKLGLIPAAGGTQRLSNLVSKGRALELLYTGRSVPADEALFLGLVEQVFAPEDLLTATMELARTLAAGPSNALSSLKRCVLDGRDGGIKLGLATEAREVRDLIVSADGREGIAAFIEKRPAQFRA